VKAAVNFNNRDEVADWLNSIMDRAYELGDIATEATAPHGARTMSKAELRRELGSTFDELRQLCRAGRHGIGAPRGAS
jgi:hypothetical protein